ncbi:hypothetical protein TanjilG_00364 [Lupinus angustifolius]|uniref:Uncharacterized protein n=1 Tax=Lupinus angustifolius TaxID=3871 RepID=A0A1J7GPF4_LUPAN|nr:hypothetical protein TanjilG_00364 [Lupinus angustifolius]
MDKELFHNNHSNGTSNNNFTSVRDRDKTDGSGSASGSASGSLLLRASSDTIRQTGTADLGLQWGNRKRLRCMKVQVKDPTNSSNPVQRTTVRVDRRVVRTDKDSSNNPTPTPSIVNNVNNNNNNQSNGYPNLRQRQPSPQQPQRILRSRSHYRADYYNYSTLLETWNGHSPSTCLPKVIVFKKSVFGRPMRKQVVYLVIPIQHLYTNLESSSAAMKGNHSNGTVRGIASPDRGAHDKRGTHNNNHLNDKSAASSDTAHDSKKGGSPSGSGDAAPPVWPPKFVIALTNKEKEEDFLAIKGSKLPQRPKKRAKFIQRTVNLVSPGAWLCDLTLERYEVREKKITKKRPRGLKAMGNMDSDSE